ncbi:MAG: glycine cleavage system aminomethyltransferase GcvT [Oligoflexia bacterium]|nr:glycine cleavage system aminomethyltransferase GcvT [Oligoflexia bacterium]
MMEALLNTELTQYHQRLHAKMAAFAGFEMPIQYTTVKEEVCSVRSGVGVFDVSHMGEFFIEGNDAVALADYLVTNDIKGAGEGRAIYSPLCREDGTVVDDLIVYKLRKDKVLLCVNAGNMQKDWQHIQRIKNATTFSAQIYDRSSDYSLLAIQGPKAVEALTMAGVLGTSDEMEFSYYSVREVKFDGVDLIVARTGYTGEDGFEVFCDHRTVVKLWERLMAQGVTPCGLAARDILRLEVCYPLYGHELSDELTPFDSGLKWTVKFHDRNFVGKEVLQQVVPRFQIIRLSLQGGIPRQGHPVEIMRSTEGGVDVVGQVTSGTLSPTINKGIALALVEKSKIEIFNSKNGGKHTQYSIIIRDKRHLVDYHDKAFITGGHK